MSLRIKILAILAACTAGAVLSHFAVGQLVVQPEFEALERDEARQNMEVVQRAFDQRVSALARLCRDWSYWDDTYEYVEDHNTKYTDSNCTPEFFTESGVNLLHIYNTQGKLVWGEIRDCQQGELMEVPGIPAEGFSPDSPWVRHTSTASEVSGLVPANPENPGGQLLWLASFPILTSETKGPIHGAMIQATLLTDDDIASLSEQANVDVSLLPLPTDHVTEDITATDGKATSQIWFVPQGKERLETYSYLRGIDGQPLRLLKIDSPRRITAQGRNVLSHATMTIFLVGLLLLVALWTFFHFLVIRPIRRVNEHLKRVGKGDLTTRIPVSLNAAPGTDEIGEVSLAFNKMTDSLQHHNERLEGQVKKRTTELAQSNSRLRQEVIDRRMAEEAAEQANRAKSEFLANMSHELRTPLHAILSFATFGTRKADSAEREQLLGYFQRIQSNGDALLALVSDLFDLSKFDAGQPRIEFGHVDLSGLARTTSDELSAMATERGIEITCHSPDFDANLVADGPKIAQVVRNLLSNAIKFSPEEGTIDVHITRSEGALRLVVLDRGIGIPESDLKAIFDKFVQSRRTQTGAGGSGLGLAICREIAVAHGGRIWAENNPGGGAKVTLELPLEIPSYNKPHQEEPSPATRETTSGPPPVAVDTAGLNSRAQAPS